MKITASFSVLALLGALSSVSAHMFISNPPSLGGVSQEKAPIFSSTDPSGNSNFCHDHIGAWHAGENSGVQWATGSQGSITISGTAVHGGGSCQVSISYDGENWTVLKSFHGNCPIENGQENLPVDPVRDFNFDFSIPGDAPTGRAIISWSWFNKVGNREMYHKCSSVEITGGGGSADFPFDQRPAMFVANNGNGCTTPANGNIRFPNPGPDVAEIGLELVDPEGNCGGGAPAPAPPPAQEQWQPPAEEQWQPPAEEQWQPPAEEQAPPPANDGGCDPASGQWCPELWGRKISAKFAREVQRL